MLPKVDEIVPEDSLARAFFETIADAAEPQSVALMSVALDGQTTAAICAVSFDGTDYTLSPVLLVVTDEIAARLADPEGRKTEQTEDERE